MTLPDANFDEDEAEFQKLHETPTCFIIIGKPVCNTTNGHNSRIRHHSFMQDLILH